MLVTACPDSLPFESASEGVFAGHRSEIIVDPLRDRDWDHMVSAHPASTFFHSAVWARTLCRTYGHRPLYRCYSHDGRMAAVIPMIEVKSAVTGCRGVSLPFSDVCPPLLFSQASSTEVFSKLVELARVRRWKYLEFRGGAPMPTGMSPSAAFNGHLLDLREGPSALFAGFSPSVRRAIRKAERCGVTVRIGVNREDILDYYRLHTESRRRHGVPPQPLSFFENLLDEAIARGYGFVALAKKDSRPIAGAVFLKFGGKAMYKFAALEFANQSLRGSNLVMWEAIKNLCQCGCESLHFGRTEISDESLRRFKLGWGTTEERIEYFRYDLSAGEWIQGRKPVSELQMALFRRMPLALNRWAGAVLYPHLD